MERRKSAPQRRVKLAQRLISERGEWLGRVLERNLFAHLGLFMPRSDTAPTTTSSTIPPQHTRLIVRPASEVKKANKPINTIAARMTQNAPLDVREKLR